MEDGLLGGRGEQQGQPGLHSDFWVTERSEADSDDNKNNATTRRRYGNSLNVDIR